jgi:hypothetical protein
MASFTNVKVPDIKAWLAIIVAMVAITTPKISNQLGIMEKNGITSPNG